MKNALVCGVVALTLWLTNSVAVSRRRSMRRGVGLEGDYGQSIVASNY
ncbi:hypothetical protein [Bradyrhizobium cenepequi]|nr:hypothetical protein [Bradyrhizobium cenepequi]MCA6111181.1 hypothetical protein [Bradyrhizobium cenepequi]